MAEYDVIVVGAGPAGSVAARDIAKAGFRVAQLEEHDGAGPPVHCSGLVTSRTLVAAGVREDSVIVNRISGALVHTPLGRVVEIGGDRTRALVIDRSAFDRALAEQVVASGATLMVNRRVTGIEVGDRNVMVRAGCNGQSTTLTADLVIGADGSHSTVARFLGFARPQESIAAIGGELQATPERGDMVEVFIDPGLAPGWFGWTIPSGRETVRVGIGAIARSRSPRQAFQDLTARNPRLSRARVLRLQGGLIPVAPPYRVSGRRAMLVGDAAGSVKPTSGGGIYTGILSAQLAAKTAIAALEQGDFSEQRLAQYGDAWTVRVRRELVLGQALRHLLMRLPPRHVDGLIGLLARPEFQSLARQHGDIDFPAQLFSKLLASRPVLRSLVALPPSSWARLAWLAFQWKRQAYRPTGSRRPV
jgi:geranylgeranyl reductase family protein